MRDGGARPHDDDILIRGGDPGRRPAAPLMATLLMLSDGGDIAGHVAHVARRVGWGRARRQISRHTARTPAARQMTPEAEDAVQARAPVDSAARLRGGGAAKAKR